MTPYLTTADTSNVSRPRLPLHWIAAVDFPRNRPVNPSPRALDVGHCIVSINVARPSYDRCRTHVARSYIRAGHLLGSKVRP